MIQLKDLYDVMVALVPLYVAMSLAYASVRWWKILDPIQCSGISRYVSAYAVPVLSFRIIASNNPYSMNLRFMVADTLEKVVVLIALGIWSAAFTTKQDDGLDWPITLYALSSLPNTLVMGIPLLGAMYGEELTGPLMVQVIMLQAVLWHTVLIVLLEYRDARALIVDQFPTDVQATSIRAEPDVVSLGKGEAEIDIAEEEEVDHGDVERRIHVVIRRSTSSIPSARTSMDTTHSRRSSFSSKVADIGIMSTNEGGGGGGGGGGIRRSSNRGYVVWGSTSDQSTNSQDFHMFNWSSTSPSQSRHVGNKQAPDHHRKPGAITIDLGTQVAREAGANTELTVVNGVRSVDGKEERTKGQQVEGNPPMPSMMVITKLILTMVWRKLIRNPNTYASVIGIAWSLVSFRWKIEMPRIVKDSISILSNTGMGMAMFSLGTFVALQPNLIACEKSVAAFALAVKFLVGPTLMAAISAIVGMRGVQLRFAIVQAALPVGIAPFIFAKEYKCHADVLSTSVIFGMVVALPVTIVYYILLDLI